MVSDALFVAVGTADTVANMIGEWGEMMGTNHFNIQAAVGDMPRWKVMKNLQLLGEEVIPRVRGKRPQSQPLAAE
jgi:alkanesulfonate monooxygenase SsuD/methylene tetrahydromethanopterin reductase-like flavin-dependent oxidoreductase (luciferase family)